MKQPKLTSITDTIPTEVDFQNLVDDCCRASGFCKLVVESEAWKKLQKLPETDKTASYKLKEAAQLIQEALGMVSSTYYEIQASEPPKVSKTLEGQGKNK